MWRRILILLGLLSILAGYWTDNPTRHNTFIPLTSMEIIPIDELMADKTVNRSRIVDDFSGAFSRDITSEVTWVIENDALATVSNDAGRGGVVTALALRETQVTAMFWQKGLLRTRQRFPPRMRWMARRCPPQLC